MLANSHSWDSLLHWTVAWEMMSSDWQAEQTGVDRVARRFKALAGSCFGPNGFRLNGFRSEGCVVISFPVEAA